MNILRVISSMDPRSGGPCEGIRNLVPELAILGINNEVLCLDDPDADFLGKDEFTIHAIGLRKGPWAYNSNLTQWLKDNLNRFDVVVIHGLWLYHDFATNKAVQNFRIQNQVSSPKLYVMPHGMLDPWFQKAESRKLKAIRNWIYWKLIEKNVINQADGLLFTSHEELILARQPFEPYFPKRELNVGYGVKAPPSFTNEMSDSLQNLHPDINKKPFLLFLSRIHIKKGVDLLIKGYLELKQEGQDLPRLVIAGPGLDTPYGREMLSLARQDNDIIFTGMLSGLSKWGAFYNCEAFILPSHQENFGIAVVEAMACSKPVLISNQVNIWTEIASGNGGIIDSDTLDGVKSMIRKWINLSVTEKEIMSTNSKNVYKKYFTTGSAALMFLNSISV